MPIVYEIRTFPFNEKDLEHVREIREVKNFGNTKVVRNYFEQIMINQANRLTLKENISDAYVMQNNSIGYSDKIYYRK